MLDPCRGVLSGGPGLSDGGAVPTSAGGKGRYELAVLAFLRRRDRHSRLCRSVLARMAGGSACDRKVQIAASTREVV